MPICSTLRCDVGDTNDFPSSQARLELEATEIPRPAEEGVGEGTMTGGRQHHPLLCVHRRHDRRRSDRGSLTAGWADEVSATVWDKTKSSSGWAGAGSSMGYASSTIVTSGGYATTTSGYGDGVETVAPRSGHSTTTKAAVVAA